MINFKPLRIDQIPRSYDVYVEAPDKSYFNAVDYNLHRRPNYIMVVMQNKTHASVASIGLELN